MSLTLVPEEIEAYAERHSEPPSPLLREIFAQTHAKTDKPQMLVGPLEGAFLRMMARVTRARRVLEIGMFTGYSALCFAEALPDDGEIITCDVDPKAEALARAAFAKSPHGKKIQIRMGPALETLKTLEGPFDLVFIDADKKNYPAYFEGALPKVRQGGLLMADSTLWSGRVLNPTEDDDKAIDAFNEKVAKDPRVEKVLLTVRDGVTLMWKR